MCNDSGTDIHNPNVIRASLGTVFTVPVAEASTQEVLAWLKENKIKSIGAITNAANLYTNSDMTGPVAIVMGSESDGLSDDWINNVDEKVKIPMNGKVDSLNLSVSTALMLYEVVRQRNSIDH